MPFGSVCLAAQRQRIVGAHIILPAFCKTYAETILVFVTVGRTEFAHTYHSSKKGLHKQSLNLYIRVNLLSSPALPMNIDLGLAQTCPSLSDL